MAYSLNSKVRWRHVMQGYAASQNASAARSVLAMWLGLNSGVKILGPGSGLIYTRVFASKVSGKLFEAPSSLSKLRSTKAKTQSAQCETSFASYRISSQRYLSILLLVLVLICNASISRQIVVVLLCRMHDQDHRISVWFNDSILTEDLSTNNREIPMGYIDG
jgi:hypothetical protein